MAISDQTEDVLVKEELYEVVHKSYKTAGDFQRAYQYFELYDQFKDSVYNKEKSLEVARTQFNFELERETERLESEQEKERLLYEQQLQQERFVQYGAFAGVLVALIIAGIIFRFYQLKTEDNKLLAYRNQIIESKSREVEARNEEIRTKNELLNARNEEILAKNEELEALREAERALAEETLASKERELTNHIT